MSSEITRNQKRYERLVSLTLFGGGLVALLVASVVQPVDWEQSWAPILLFSIMLALAWDLGLTAFADRNGAVHIVILAAMLAVGFVPALWVNLLGTAMAEVVRWLVARRTSEIPRLSRAAWLSDAAQNGINGLSFA